MRITRAITAIFTLLADLVAPRRCAGCDHPHAMGSATRAFCQSCSTKLADSEPGPHWAAVQFGGPVRKAVHRLKFESRSDLGRVLGEELAARFTDSTVASACGAVDLVTCIPLSSHRLAERGFNQAGLLARPLARRLGVPFQPGAVTRLRDTTKQSSLGREERADNVEGAFHADTSRVRGKVVLIVDDVVTTGETFGAAQRALLDAGARDVLCVALARAGSSVRALSPASARDAPDDLP